MNWPKVYKVSYRLYLILLYMTTLFDVKDNYRTVTKWF